MAGAVRVDLVRTNGIFSLDGQDFEVENNVWLVGDDEHVLVVDAAHDAAPIVKAVGGRRVVLIVSTHGHNDHINAADALAEITGAPVALHPDDAELWAAVYRRRRPDRALADGEHIPVGDHRLEVIHTPGHSPGGVCLYDPGPASSSDPGSAIGNGSDPGSGIGNGSDPGSGIGNGSDPGSGIGNGVLFSGDTLFRGGPGATGRSFSSFPTIIESIRTRLLTLPGTTTVHPGHGDNTTIAEEAPHLQEWIDRGY